MALIYLIILIYIVMIFIEVSIISLKVTGMSREKARFQVISLLTSTGFTTRESELITQHPIRRKIAERIMIFKFFAGIIGAATLVNVYIDMMNRKFDYLEVTVWLIMLTVIFAVLKNRRLVGKIDFFIEKQLRSQASDYKRKYSSQALLESDDFGIVDVVLDQENYLIGLRIKDSGLKTKSIAVLQIGKGDKHYPFPKPDYMFEAGDKITIYGKLEAIKGLVTSGNEEL